MTTLVGSNSTSRPITTLFIERMLQLILPLNEADEGIRLKTTMSRATHKLLTLHHKRLSSSTRIITTSWDFVTQYHHNTQYDTTMTHHQHCHRLTNTWDFVAGLLSYLHYLISLSTLPPRLGWENLSTIIFNILILCFLKFICFYD